MRLWHPAHEAALRCFSTSWRTVRPSVAASSSGSWGTFFGRLGQPLAEQALEQPVAAQDRAGARRARLLRQDRAQGEHAAAPLGLDPVDPTPLGSLDPRDPVMLGQRFVQEGMVALDELQHRPVIAKQVDEEPDRLLVKVGTDLGERREMALALLVVGVEVADLEPLACELGGQAADPVVADHAVGPARPARRGHAAGLRRRARRSASSGIEAQRK